MMSASGDNWTPGEIASIKNPDPKGRGYVVVQEWTDPRTGKTEWRAIRTLHESIKVKRSSGDEF